MGRGYTWLLYIDYRTFCIDTHILFNSMGSWYMNVSDNMGGQCLWKLDSMGGGVKIKGIFLWNSPYFIETLVIFCKQSRSRSCKSCLIRVYPVCLWKYDISDPTLVDLTSIKFLCSMYQHENLFIELFLVGGA